MVNITSILLNILLIFSLIYTINKDSAALKTASITKEVIRQYEVKEKSIDHTVKGYEAMKTYLKANAFDVLLTSK